MCCKASLARYFSCFMITEPPETPPSPPRESPQDLDQILFPTSPAVDIPSSLEPPVSALVELTDRLDDVVMELQGWKRTIHYSRPSNKDITQLENQIIALEGAASRNPSLDCSPAIQLSRQLRDELKHMVVDPVPPSAYVLQGKQSHIEKSHAYGQILKPLLKRLKLERENLKTIAAQATATHPSDPKADDAENPKSKIADKPAAKVVPGRAAKADDRGDRLMTEDHLRPSKVAAKPTMDLNPSNSRSDAT